MLETAIPSRKRDTSASRGTRKARRVSRAFLIGAAALALTAGCGCSPSAPATVVVTAFDISSSTNTASVRERYFAGFQCVVSGFSSGDAFLTGYPITADTEATSMARLSQAFPAFNPLQDNRDQHDAKLAQARADAVTQARALLTGLKTAPATDLLNAFDDAAKTFNGAACRATPDKRLVVFSDMVQQAGADDFLREDLTEQRIGQIIAVQRASGQLPDLKGVRVWVAGATADAEGRIRPDKIAQIRRFWIAYFRACGADLTPERYGTTLLNYP